MHQAMQQAQGAQGTATREAERARQEMERAQTRIQERALTFTTRAGGDYNIGKDLLGQRQYEQAIARFDKVIAQKGRQRRRRALLEGLRSVQAGQERRRLGDDRAAPQGLRAEPL